jgi:hypothetical protein
MFGYGLEDADAVPALVESILEERGFGDVETVNAGVGGYATWQERVYLETEGVKFSPDLVVLGFVLNDVVNDKDLIRFGGTGIGYELSQSYYSLYDRLAHHSALVHFAERARTRIRLGPDAREGARRIEILSVEELVEKPGHAKVKALWEEALRDLDLLYASCRERRLPLLVVIFPETMQLFSWAGTSPQQIVADHAARSGVPVLDPLPGFRRAREEENLVARAFFLDHNHLSALGSRLAAEAIAERIADGRLLDPVGAGRPPSNARGRRSILRRRRRSSAAPRPSDSEGGCTPCDSPPCGPL